MTAPRPLGYWLKALDRLVDGQFEQAAEQTGLSPGEWRVLSRLTVGAEQSETAAESLAPLTEPDRDAPDTLRALEKAGLVEQQGQEHRLTDEGHRRAKEIEDAATTELRTRLGSTLTEQEYDDLLATLERTAKALGWTPV